MKKFIGSLSSLDMMNNNIPYTENEPNELNEPL